MYPARLFITGLALILFSREVVSQQLKLGNNPYTVQKSAILDMESSNQGLLLVRLSDTTSINLLSPPDGMVIYFTPTKQLMVRSNGYWKPLSFTFTGTGFIKVNGTTISYDNSTYLTSVDTTNISNFYLKVRSLLSAGTGISYNNTTGAIAAKRVYYSGGAGGGTATVDNVTKVWVAEVSNVNGGVQTINFPGNLTFSSILNIQVTAKGGTNVTTSPIAMVTSNTTSSVSIRVLESTTIVAAGEGLQAHDDTNTKIYIRVEGT